MGYYLLDNPPASRQFYETRANTPTWAVGVHTTESIMDTVSVDTGAENVAGFISRRSDPGSYHVIVDSDSSVPMVPDSYTAFQIGASGFNSRTLGVALACRESELDPDHWWTQRAIVRLGVEIRTRWLDKGIDPASAAWWGSGEDAMRTACLFNHGDAQPWDRRDAFVDHPQQVRLQQMVIDAIVSDFNQEEAMTDDQVRLMQAMHDVTRADARNAVTEATTTLVGFVQAAHDVTRAYLANVIKAAGILDDDDISKIVAALPEVSTEAVISEFVDRLSRPAA